MIRQKKKKSPAAYLAFCLQPFAWKKGKVKMVVAPGTVVGIRGSSFSDIIMDPCPEM